MTHHALESSYFQVFLWKQAVEKEGKATPDAIRTGKRPANGRAERAREDRSAEPAYLAHAADRPVAGGRPGQNRR